MTGRSRLPRGRLLAPRPQPHPLQTRFQLVRPPGSHWRRATCAEVQCVAHLEGWDTVLPADDDRCDYIRARSGRAFTEHRVDGGLVAFRFPPGQTCFAAADHQVPIEREPLYLVRGHRPRQHTRGELWVEDMSERLDVVRDRRGG